MAETKRFVVSHGTAVALGVVGTLLLGGLALKEGRATVRSVSVSKLVPAGAVAALDNWLETNACPPLVSEAGMPACSAEDLLNVHINRDYRDEDGDLVARVEPNAQYEQVYVPLGPGASSLLKTWIVNQTCNELMVAAPSSACTAGNVFDITFTRNEELGWRVRAEAAFSETCSEGSPE